MLPVAEPPRTKRWCTYAVVGNPNAGKSTLFNALTGLRQKVGNYPGVTVERKEGLCYSQHGKHIHLVDLPGAYSLVAWSPDEAIMRDVLFGRVPGIQRPDRVLVVVDASHLERSLYLAAQVLETGLPAILVLNMMDAARAAGVEIDGQALSRHFGGVEVVECQATASAAVTPVRLAMSRSDLTPPVSELPLEPTAAEAVAHIGSIIKLEKGEQPTRVETEALSYLMSISSGATQSSHLSPRLLSALEASREQLDRESPGWHERVIADRYRRVSEVVEAVVRKGGLNRVSVTERLDQILTHRAWGWLFLGGIMGGLFFAIFSLAEYPMALIEWLVEQTGAGVAAVMPEGALRDLLLNGMLAGVGGIIVFLPQILILFFFIGLLEGTGYLARAAFLLDRVMGRVGLHGKSFIPLLSSYACAIPGIMATRTIDSPRHRLATIMIAPFMSCSARLPVYLLLITAMIPNSTVSPGLKAALLLGLYSLGTGGALLTAWFFRNTLLRGGHHGGAMELPAYRLPSLKNVMTDMLERGKIFLRRAGTVILGISILLWFLTNFPRSEGNGESQLAESYAGQLGRAIEPAIEPLGYDWKIGIGLISSFAAREVFVSTMAVVYHVADPAEDVESLRDVLLQQVRPNGRPVYTPLVCASLLVFYVFALQCVSTVAIVRRETNSWRWPLFQLLYMTAVAYGAAALVYQGGRLLGL